MTGSSPEASVIETDPVSIQPDASDTAKSSIADQNGDNVTLLDSVREAIKSGGSTPLQEQDPQNPGKSQDPAEAKPETAKAPDANEQLGDLTDEELAKYGPKTQARMRQLLGQRGELRSQVEKLEPKAKQFDEIDTFIRQNNLSNEDVGVIFQIGAAIRNDPFKALEQVSAIHDKLVELTGGKLPADLQERVKLGYISQEDAVELSRNRSKLAHTESSRAETEKRSAKEAEVEQHRKHAADCKTTADKWEDARKSRDPDWNLKQPRMRELLRLSVYENGFPQTQEDFVKQLDGFYKQVTDDLLKIRPNKPEVKPVTHAASTRGKAEPSDLLGFVKTGLGRA